VLEESHTFSPHLSIPRLVTPLACHQFKANWGDNSERTTRAGSTTGQTRPECSLVVA